MGRNRKNSGTTAVHTRCDRQTVTALRLAIMLFTVGATGCVSTPRPSVVFAPTPPVAANTVTPVDGSIYQPVNNRFFFEDIRARRIGDVINVVLDERTDATKSASTKANKASAIGFPNPTLFGGALTLGGRALLANDITGSTDFQGSGDSSQSNRLSGSIAVTVADVLPNGNLIIRGQKQLTLNQGSELVQLTGIVRAEDVTPSNTVLSTQIADANITYGGRGLLADANRPGWLTRLFSSPIWPL